MTSQKRCPMCQGDRFFVNSAFAYDNTIMLGAFKGIAVYASICLSCGFVSRTLDEAGLVKINKLAEESAQAGGDKPDGRGFREV